tara:strand:- start:7 stop:285 length:279 start_codon:yes stop_codon:yes gene_type:complete
MTDDELYQNVCNDARTNRNGLLSRLDNMNPIAWESLTDEVKNSWKDYRQELLDIPQQAGFPHSIVWPTITTVGFEWAGSQPIADNETPPTEA